MEIKNIKQKLLKFFNKAWDFVLPDNLECIFCGKEIGDKNEYSTCEKCYDKFLNKGKVCEKCGEFIFSKSKYCLSCKKRVSYTYVIARAPFVYTGETKKVVYKLKYQGGRYLAKYMAQFMALEYQNMNVECDLIVPVPIHKTKLKARGYNQAQLLGEELSKLIYVPINQDLIKEKPTKTQTALTKEKRQENLSGTFNVLNNENLFNKTILLVDDVFTTGATVEECSRMLLKEGANKVYALTFAHTPKNVKYEK